MPTTHLRSGPIIAAMAALLALAPACAVGDEDSLTDDAGDEVPDLEGPDEWTPEALATSEPDDVGSSCTYREDCDWYAQSGRAPRVCFYGSCRLQRYTFHPGACTAHGCWPDHMPTADRRCREASFTKAVSQQTWQVAGDRIWVAHWTPGTLSTIGIVGSGVPSEYGGGWTRGEIGGGRAMQRVTCERVSNRYSRPAPAPAPPPPPPPAPLPAPPLPAKGAAVSFKTHLWPRLKANCASCHSDFSEVSAGYKKMRSTSTRCDSKRWSVPGNATASLVYQKVTGTQTCGGSMAGYSNSTIRDLMRRWINEGARAN